MDARDGMGDIFTMNPYRGSKGTDREISVVGEDIYSQTFLEKLLKEMYKIYFFEEEMLSLQQDGLIHGSLHLCKGEEAVSAGSVAALKPQDRIFTTHRGHGVCIARGMDLKKIASQILGRNYDGADAISGSMHLSDRSLGLMGGNGVVGANVPLAVGAALAIKKKNYPAKLRVSGKSYSSKLPTPKKDYPDQVSVSFFGDGAINQGVVMESMNLAGLWKLPVIFLLTDNHYAVSTTTKRASADPDFIKRAAPFKLNSLDVDGDDVLSVYEAVKKARNDIISGKGPYLIVMHTYRLSAHSRSDPENYRSMEEIDWHKEHSAIKRFERELMRQGIFTEYDIRGIALDAQEEVSDAVSEAMGFPLSNPDKKSLLKKVYATPVNKTKLHSADYSLHPLVVEPGASLAPAKSAGHRATKAQDESVSS